MLHANTNKLVKWWLESYERITDWLISANYEEEIYKYLEKHPGLQSVPYWVAAALVGFLAVAYAELFEALGLLAKQLHESVPLVFLIVSPLCFMAAYWLVYRFAPKAGGSGIPQVTAAIESAATPSGKFINELLGLKTATIKMLSSFLLVLGGGAIGREGPTIQIAASVFNQFGLWFRRFWPSAGHQPWWIAGGAAGIAAAFNTPLGGIVFAIEELAPLYFTRVRTVLISAVIISGMLAQWIWGSYLYFGTPLLKSTNISTIPWAILIGLVCGVTGGYFGKWLYEGLKRIRRLTPQKRILMAGFFGAIIVATAHALGAEVLGGGAEVVRSLLFEKDQSASMELIVGRYLTTFLSYLSGAAGGIFAPSLALGGALGSFINSVASIGNANVMVLLGMAAFLSAVTRAPFTALILVFEMTDRHSIIFYLMVSSLVAYHIAKLIDKRSFYEWMLEEYLSELPGKKPETPTEPSN